MTNIITSKAQFEDLELTVIHKDGQRWLTAEQVGKALGYADPQERVNQLFRRYRHEFILGEDFDVIDIRMLSEEAFKLKASSAGLPASLQPSAKVRKKLRLFSLQGCYLLGFLASTDRAASFRLWARRQLLDQSWKNQEQYEQQLENLRRQVEVLQRMNAALRRELLAARPLWRRIHQLKQMRGPLGERLSHREISRALRRAPSTLRKHIRRMEAIGLLEPAPDYERQRRLAANLPLFRDLDNLH